MGKADIETKQYMSDPAHFADAFNYLIYQGQPVIRPENLVEMDTTQIAIPESGENREPTQKYRDVLKLLQIMEDEKNIYVALGIENQNYVHYAMPARCMLYDAMQYMKQVEEIARKNKQKKSGKSLSGSEFLSGFRKDDKLVPVITAVIYFAPDKWDGPRSIREMLNTDQPEILKNTQDYQLHLIAPTEIEDKAFAEFQTGFGQVMEFIKYSKDKNKLETLLRSEERFKAVDLKTAELIRVLTNSKIEIDEGKETVNMCQALDEICADYMEKGVKQGIEQGRRQGMEQGKNNACLRMTKNLMKTLHLSLPEAMDVLKIPPKDRKYIMDNIQ